ncbi:MAG TPA: cobalamin-binding protein, partial [Syntrophobacteraceae bacterium]|nr:cobalamin-binding protein [Syntrophobacteraceae bacterium]
MKKSLRIISLAPTQTEILAALGLIQELAGVTSDCDYPNTVR